LTKKLHICLLTSARIFEMAYGGEGRYTISLGNWLARQDHDVTLMGSGFASVKAKRLSKSAIKEDDKEKIIIKQKKIKTLDPPYYIYALSRLVMSLLWILKILLLNIKYPITLIHAQDTGYSGLSAVISGKILGIPVIISSHGIRHKTLESIIQGRLKKVLLKIEYILDIFTIKNANSVIVVNPSIKNYFEQIISKKIVDFIPIPIKLKNFEFSEANRDLIRKELRIEDNKTKVIGFVGRLGSEKNVFTLLISFANVVKNDPLIKLVLVGTGPLEPKLREYVSKSGIEDKIIFCGVRYDIGRLLAGFDIFVLISYIEGLSTALLEAMASGRAVIVSNIPANRELVTHNQEGLLVNPYNPEELEQAIQLLSNDHLLRLKLGYNAKNRVSQYDEDIVFPKILQYYQTLSRERRKN
jgi:glycosyltransferase involved in cell wall biosynthesis